MKKAVIYQKKGDLQIIDMEIPRVEPGKVLVRIAFCGICGTDIHLLEGGFPVAFPHYPGHECSGVVEEVGEGVKMFKKGDRVVWIPMAEPCGNCVFCRKGQDNFCLSRQKSERGGYAEYSLVEERKIYHLPDSVPLEEGAMMEPLSIVVHAVDVAEIKTADRVLIAGAGTIGLLLLQVVLRSGATTVILSEPDKQRRDLAQRLGAHAVVDPLSENLAEAVLSGTGGLGVDVVMEAAGSVQPCEQSVELARRGGKVIFVGVVPQGKKISLSHFDIYAKELVIKGVGVNFHTYQRAVDLLPVLSMKPLITHQFDLVRLPEALEAFKRREGIKILIRCRP
jgi:2-desacetyl-2-hydroxyethyl bacteriochlorophyllide A dehydrogenase